MSSQNLRLEERFEGLGTWDLKKRMGRGGRQELPTFLHTDTLPVSYGNFQVIPQFGSLPPGLWTTTWGLSRGLGSLLLICPSLLLPPTLTVRPGLRLPNSQTFRTVFQLFPSYSLHCYGLCWFKDPLTIILMPSKWEGRGMPDWSTS